MADPNVVKRIETLLKNKCSLDDIAAILETHPEKMHTTNLIILVAEYGRIDVLDYILENRTNQQSVTRAQFLNRLFPPNGWNVLHSAVNGNQLDTVNYLLDMGADIDAKTTNEYTSLHIAAKLGNEIMINLLLENGARLDIKNNNNLRAYEVSPIKIAPNYLAQLLNRLKEAVRTNNINTIQQFADQNYRWLTLPLNVDGSSMLHRALELGNFTLFTYVLDKLSQKIDASKAELIARYTARTNWNALHYAVQGGNAKAVSYLLDLGVDVNATTAAEVEGWSPLHLAFANGNVAIADELIKQGADLSLLSNELEGVQRTPYQMSPLTPEMSYYFKNLQNSLLQALQSNDFAQIKKLVDAHNPSILLLPLDKKGANALQLKAQSGDIVSVEYILNKLSKFTGLSKKELIDRTQAPHDSTALHYAVKAQNSAVLKYFLSQSANINPSKRDLLHIAVAKGNKEVVETLVNNGINLVNLSRYKQKTIRAYQIDKANTKPKFINHLLSIIQSFESAIENGDIETIEAYLKQNPTWLNLLIADGTILHVAARNKATLIHFLINYLRETPQLRDLIFCKDGFGLTPFDYLALNENEEYYNQLHSFNMDVNLSESYTGARKKILHTIKTNNYALLPAVAKHVPACIEQKEIIDFLKASDMKTQISTFLAIAKENDETFNIIIENPDLNKILHAVVRKDYNFLPQLLTVLSPDVMVYHQKVLLSLMAEAQYAKTNAFQTLKHIFVKDPLSSEEYAKLFIKDYIEYYNNVDDSALFTKATIFDIGLFHQKKDINLAAIFYEKISKNDILQYLELRYELVSFYIFQEKSTEARVILQDLITTAKKALEDNPDSLFIKNMLNDVERLSLVLDKTLGQIIGPAKLEHAAISLRNAVGWMSAASNKFKEVKLSESRYCSWKPEPTADEKDQPVVIPENTAPKAVK